MRQKRFLSWLLTLCLLLGMFSFPAYAEGNTTTITQDTPNQQGTMNITLTITGTLSDSNVTLSADSFTYNGSTQKPTVTVKHRRGTGTEVTLTENTDYTVAITKGGNAITNPTDVGTYTVTVTGKGVYSGSGSKTYSITASTPGAPAAPTKASATKNSITLNAASGCEYSKDGTNWQDSTEFTGLNPGTEYTFYQRVKSTANMNASSASSASFSTEADTYAMTITLTIKEMAASAENVSVVYDGQPHGITVNVTDPASGYTVKYGTTEGTYDLDASPTQTEVGTRTVYYQVTADNYVVKTGSATVTINRANAIAATVTANNRTYDGTDKPLVNADNSTLVGGEMWYALGENATTAPADNLYTTSIPSKTDAGTYYVWYKVIGDANHNDSEDDFVEAKINPVDKTDLNNAIKEADDTAAAKKVTDAINALPAKEDVTSSDKEAVEAVRAAYNALTASQKDKIDTVTLKKLTDAKEALKAAEKAESDKAAADAVKTKINALKAADKITTADKAAIEAARKAYDALSADQKKLVDAATLKKLTDTEKALTTAEANDKVAKELEAAKQEAQAAMNEQVTVTQKGNKFTVKWKKASSADGYYVYAQYCGKKATKPVKTIKKNSTTKTTITKIDGKKINQKKNFRVYVAPYKIVDGKKVTLGKSMTAHLVGSKNTKYSNVKKLTLTKSKYTVKVGKTAKIKAKVTLVNKNKKHIPKSHGAKFRYKSSDTSIANVDKNGKIKGIKKGTCTIYVYSINGLMKKAKVTVK